MNDKGEIDSAKVKEAIEKVLEDVPAFKAEAKQSGFTKVGAGGSGGGDAESELEKSMKSIMGLS